MGVFGDINKVEIMGNITQDIELRHTPNGSAVCNFSVATNRNFKLGEEWKDEVTYHNVVVWGNDAQQLATRARKGTRVYIQGRIQTRSWEDQEGKKQYKTEVVSEKIILIDRYNKAESDAIPSNTDTNFQNTNPSKYSEPAQPSQSNKNSDEDIIDPDDLPF